MHVSFSFIITYGLSLVSTAASAPSHEEPSDAQPRDSNLVSRGCGDYYWSIDRCYNDDCPGRCIAIMAQAKCDCDGFTTDDD